MRQEKPRSGAKRIWSRLLLIGITAIAVISVTVGAYYIKKTDEVVNTFEPAYNVTPSVNETFENNVKQNVSFNVGETEYPVYVRAQIIITWKKLEETEEAAEPGNGENAGTPNEGNNGNEAGAGNENGNDNGEAKPEDESTYIVSYKQPVKGTDYTLDLNLTDWKLGKDGFYYYVMNGADPTALKTVESRESTDKFIISCRQLDSATPPEDGYFLSVDIIVQTVQAVGSTDDEPGIPAYQHAWGTLSWASSGNEGEAGGTNPPVEP